MTTFPTHELAQFERVLDIPASFDLISTDHAFGIETFRYLFGSDLPYIQSDYQYFFTHETDDITVYYGVGGTPYFDRRVDLVYFAESGNDQIYSPYFGSHLEESPVWGHETTDGVNEVEVAGLVPFTDETNVKRGVNPNNCFVGYSVEKKPRLVLFYAGADEFANLYTRKELERALKIWQKDKWFRPHVNDTFIRHYTQLIKLANQWGIK